MPANPTLPSGSGDYADALIADLGLPYGSPEARTIAYMVDQLHGAHDRIQQAATNIRSRLTTVDARFSEGDLATVHLNGLGELQSLGPAYDAAVASFEATRAQLTMYTARLAGERTAPGSYADTARRDAASTAEAAKPSAPVVGHDRQVLKPVPTLYVRNAAQKVLWDDELAGQISDGHWENARPHDHWKVWCDATVVVRPEAVGRTFYARRTAYNFTDAWLLDIIGERMVASVQQAGQPDYNKAKMLKDLRDLKAIIKTETTHDAIDFARGGNAQTLG